MRKGQVTLFVILGLVLLLVVALFMFSRNALERPVDPQQGLTHDFAPIKASYESHAERCLVSEAAPLFQRAFSHGGFLEPSGYGFVGFEDFPTRGSALPLGEHYLVPYWFEQESSVGCRGDCRFSINVPPLRAGEGSLSIEEQVSARLADEVRPCLASFDAGPDYEVSQAEDFSVDVFIGEGGVDYELHRDVSFSFLPTGAVSSLGMVRAHEGSDLLSLYENGVALMDYLLLLNKEDSLSEAVKLIINARGLTDDRRIPPMRGGMSFAADAPDMWFLPEVRDEVELALADDLPFVQVSGSKDQRLFLDPNRYSQALYTSGPFKPDIFFPHPADVQRTSFSLIYDPQWPIDLQVSPGGYLIRPEGFSINIPFLPALGSYTYDFSYDAVVPVLFVIRDEEAFGGSGLTLMYAAEVGLAGNEPPLYSEQGVSVAEAGLFDDEGQRMDGLAAISAFDALTAEPLEDVEVSYHCGDQAVLLGTTDSSGVVVDSLPFCLGGVVRGSLQGYYAQGAPLSVLDDEDYDVELPMAPLQEFALRFEGYQLNKQVSSENLFLEDGTVAEDYADEADELSSYGISPTAGVWRLGSQPGALQADDSLTLLVKRVVGPGEPEQHAAYVVNYSNEDEHVISLAPGRYEVEAFLLEGFGEGHSREEFVVPAREECVKDECVTLEKLVYNDTLYRGGVSLKGALALNVTFDDYENDTLVIRYLMVNLEDVERHEDLGALGEIEGYTRMYNETLMPRFEVSS